jgi:hypothetical protein
MAENCSNKLQNKVSKSSWMVMLLDTRNEIDRYKTHDIEIVVDRMVVEVLW